MFAVRSLIASASLGALEEVIHVFFCQRSTVSLYLEAGADELKAEAFKAFLVPFRMMCVLQI